MASTGATDGPFKTQARSRRTCHSLKADGREDEPTQPSERPLPGHGNAARSPGPRRSGGHGPAKAGDAEREASPREALRRCASLESPSRGEPSPSATRAESLRRGACPFVDLVMGEEHLFRPVCPRHTKGSQGRVTARRSVQTQRDENVRAQEAEPGGRQGQLCLRCQPRFPVSISSASATSGNSRVVFFFGPFLPSPPGRFNSSSPSMRLRLASRRQTKPVAAWLGRNVREATHEDRAPREFSRTHTAASPDFFHALSHPCPLLGRPPRNENPISHWSWQLISPFAAFSICCLPGLGAGSVPILPENTRLFFLFFFLLCLPSPFSHMQDQPCGEAR